MGTQKYSIIDRGFQMELPVYVKPRVGFKAGGRRWSQHEVFPWRELGMKPEKVAAMFPRLLRHNLSDLEKIGADPKPSPRAGDEDRLTVVPEKDAENLLASKSLDDMTIRELRIVGKEYGAPVKRTRVAQQEAVEAAMKADA